MLCGYVRVVTTYGTNETWALIEILENGILKMQRQIDRLMLSVILRIDGWWKGYPSSIAKCMAKTGFLRL